MKLTDRGLLTINTHPPTHLPSLPPTHPPTHPPTPCWPWSAVATRPTKQNSKKKRALLGLVGGGYKTYRTKFSKISALVCLLYVYEDVLYIYEVYVPSIFTMCIWSQYKEDFGDFPEVYLLYVYEVYIPCIFTISI
jgi:hypothetical protein